MRLSISHTTQYRYSEPAWSNVNELRLAPEETSRQKPGSLNLKIEPGAPVKESRDVFGNLVHSFEVEDDHDNLLITAESIVETSSSVTADLIERAKKVALPDLKLLELDEWDYQFVTDSTFVEKSPDIWHEALDVHHFCEKNWGTLIEELSDFVFENCVYEEQWIHQMKSVGEVQREKKGTCQDFAHLLLGYCRALGLPARYISGYLYDPVLDTGEHSGLVGAGQSHAWIEVNVPEVGWIGIDPTNQQWVDDHYVSLAFGRDYHDVAPVRGSLIGGGSDRSLTVSVKVKAASE